MGIRKLLALALASVLPNVAWGQSISLVEVDSAGKVIGVTHTTQPTGPPAYRPKIPDVPPPGLFVPSPVSTSVMATPPNQAISAPNHGPQQNDCASGNCGCPRCAPTILSRFTVRHDFGDGPGFDNGFTYVEGFVPLFQERGSWLIFGDVRVVNFDHHDLWEFNGGFGARRYNCDTNRILGVYGFYDGRTTLADNFFHQITMGVESLGQYLDFRANVYIPIGDDRQFVGFTNPQFRGFNILLDGVSEVALRGADAEVGTPVPYLEKWDTRAFIGYYHYSNEGVQAINGVRGRMEANVSDRVTLHLSVQNDAVYDTTVYGGVALHFGGGRKTKTGYGRGVQPRLGDRVVRDPNIVTGNGSVETVATDVNTGNPIIVRHASSNAAAGGDGTVEKPFQDLPKLQAGANANEILFAHAGSVFNKQAITLKSGQRFLGEGVDHTFASQQGTFLLPRATSNSALPIIQNSASHGVVLASNTEVAGFDIRNAGDDAIRGVNISNVTIRKNIITNPDDDGIKLDDVTGTATIENNTITNAGDQGIDIAIDGTRVATYVVLKNVISGSENEGILFNFDDNAYVSGVVADNRITNAEDEASLAFQLRGDSRGRFSVLRNVISNNQSEAGIDIDVEDNALGFFQIARNAIANNADPAINADADDDSRLFLQIFGNTVNQNITVNEFGGSVVQMEGTFTPNTLENVLQAGATATAGGGVLTGLPIGTFSFPAP